MRDRSVRLRIRILGVAAALTLLCSGPALAEAEREHVEAPPVSIGEPGRPGGPLAARSPRTLPGTRAAEAHRLANLDPARWLQRFGHVSATPAARAPR